MFIYVYTYYYNKISSLNFATHDSIHLLQSSAPLCGRVGSKLLVLQLLVTLLSSGFGVSQLKILPSTRHRYRN